MSETEVDSVPWWNDPESPDLNAVKYAVKRVLLDGSAAADFPVQKILTTDLSKQPASMLGFHVFGPCPTCHGHSSALCATKYLSIAGDAPASPLENAELVRTPRDTEKTLAEATEVKRSELTRSQITIAKCACVGVHAGQPAGVFGCGSEWMLKVYYNPAPKRLDDDVFFEPVKSADAYKYWQAADANGATIPASLTTVQSAAAKWQTALTGLVGLVGVGAFVTNRDTIHAFPALWIAAFYMAFALAVFGNARLLWKSDLATGGIPQLDAAPTARQLESADLLPLRQAEAALTKLNAAFFWAKFTLASSIITIGTLLVAPKAANSTAPTYKVTESTPSAAARSYTTPCGKLSTGPEKFATGDSVTPDGEAQIDINGIVTKVEAC